MPFSFPASPTVGQTSTQNGRQYVYAGNNTWELVAASGGGSLSGSVTIPESGDPQWANTVLLLKGDGNLTDSSATPKTVTAVNGATATGAAKYGSASISLDGTQYLSLPYSSAFDLSSGDWTAEAWAYLPTISRRVLFGINSGADYVAAVLVMVNDDGSVYLLCESSSGSWIGGAPSNGQTSAGAFPAAQWNHVAAVRAGDVFTLYINGVSAVTYTNSAAQSNRSAASYIGFRQADSGGIWNGRVDDVRITKAARYSGSSFTPPTAAHPTGTYIAPQTLPVTISGSGGSGLSWSSVPASATASGTAGSIAYDHANGFFYVATAQNSWKRAALSSWTLDPYLSSVSLHLHFDGNLTDSSPSPKTITAIGNASATGTAKFGSASLSLDGNGDGLQVAGFPTGTENFTVEFFVRRSAAWTEETGNRYILDYADSDSSLSGGFQVYLNGSIGALRCSQFGVGVVLDYSVSSLAANTWYHFAYVRSGSTVTLYKSGTSVASTTGFSGSFGSPATGLQAIGIGSYLGSYQAGSSWNGQIDEVRITRGVARTITAEPTAAYPDS